MISAPLEELLPRLTESERAKLDPANVAVARLAETRLVFIVHESNPIRSLTIAQPMLLVTLGKPAGRIARVIAASQKAAATAP